MDTNITTRVAGLVVHSGQRELQMAVGRAVDLAHEMGVAVYDDGDQFVFDSPAQRAEFERRLHGSEATDEASA